MPVPWHDVATKDDLRLLRSDLDVLRAELRADMHQGFTSQTRWLMGYVTGLSAVMLAVARLLF